MKSNQKRIFDQMEKYHSGNSELKSEAIEEIVADHRKYVSRVINKYFFSYKSAYWEDMFQAGIVGMIESLENYDPKVSRPTTYFHFFIIHEISEFIAKIVHRTSSHHSNRIMKINKAEAELQKRGIFDPTITDIAVETGMPVETVLKTCEQRTMSQTQSLENDSFMDSVAPDTLQSPERLLEMKEAEEILQTAIDSLSNEEREVIIRKYGLFNQKIQSNSDISKETGITVNTIRSYQQSAIRKLRKNPIISAFFYDNTKDVAKEISNTPISLIPVEAISTMMEELVSEEDINF